MINPKNKHILTIFCPVYNKESYIERCFESILKQKTSFKYKILVIDDKSTDKSVEIIRKYIEKYPEVFEFYQNENNLKTLATSIRGYEIIDTKYYCVLDPDDYWLDEDCLDSAIKFLEKHSLYTRYASNCWLEYPDGHREKMCKWNTKKSTFNMKKEYIFSHTSCSFFVNNFNDEIIKKLKAQVGTINERVYEGDSFRNVLAMVNGLTFILDECKTVYNYDGKGIWSQLSTSEQLLLNIRFYLQTYKFFNCEHDALIKMSYTYFHNIFIQNNISFEILENFYSIYSEFLVTIKDKKVASKLGYPKNIIFFLPSKILGGYETCFFRWAKFLSEKLCQNVYFIDYKDGICTNELAKSKVKLIKYKDGKILNLPAHSVTILPITWAYQFKLSFLKNTKFLFWVAHPKALTWLACRSKKSIKFLEKFIKNADKYKAIKCMDLSCKNSIRNVDLSERYLPVFVPSTNLKASRNLINGQEINIGWLGRLDKDKINSLLNILENYNNYETSKKKIIHIIGSGTEENLVKPEHYENIEIKLLGRVMNKELDNYMINNVDILFGMGASLLEAAKLNIPATLVKISDIQFDDNKYILLSNLNSYILGYIQDDDVATCKKNTIDEILDDIYINCKKEELGDFCYKYYQKYHSLEYSVFCLMQSLTETKYSWGRLLWLEIKENLTKIKNKIIKKK
ncbi:glycosyltransferase [bacterium]|nr:glycosyltransferase [bacterium]